MRCLPLAVLLPVRAGEQVLADQEHAAKLEEIARKDQLSIAKFNAAMRKIQLQEKEAKGAENASV